MAVSASLPTTYGETREVYVRINSASISNHGTMSAFLFRGYVSKEAFRSGSSFIWELEAELLANVSENPWGQAYAHLKKLPEFADATDC